VGGREGGGVGGKGGGGGRGGETTQAWYAHMNNKTIKIKKFLVKLIDMIIFQISLGRWWGEQFGTILKLWKCH
jgi:hypothetical protein